jgi:DNA-binding response OmpR family regulator
MNMPKIILLIDDDEDEFYILKMALEATNNQSTCMWASNLEDAIRSLQEFHPEIVFIDINMPKDNGFICLEELKRNDPIGHSAFIIYSTSINEADQKKALDSGASYCMRKAQNLSVLKKQLTKLFNNSHILGDYIK